MGFKGTAISCFISINLKDLQETAEAPKAQRPPPLLPSMSQTLERLSPKFSINLFDGSFYYILPAL